MDAICALWCECQNEIEPLSLNASGFLPLKKLLALNTVTYTAYCASKPRFSGAEMREIFSNFPATGAAMLSICKAFVNDLTRDEGITFIPFADQEDTATLVGCSVKYW